MTSNGLKIWPARLSIAKEEDLYQTAGFVTSTGLTICRSLKKKTTTGRLVLWHQPDWRSDPHDCRSLKKKTSTRRLVLWHQPDWRSDLGPVAWRPTTVKWRQSLQSNRHSTVGTRQTEYHEALPSTANVQSHLTSFADDGNASWYSVCRVPMVDWRLDYKDCRHLTVVGLHDTGLCTAVDRWRRPPPCPGESNRWREDWCRCGCPIRRLTLTLSRRSKIQLPSGYQVVWPANFCELTLTTPTSQIILLTR